ncbi:MAG TPA: DinB family protein [Dehalococcoidia bacterium]|nr:DinB family protein [Dehalococcoidia bacterium]
MNRKALLEALHSTGDEFVAKMRAVPDDAWSQGRYENGWNAKQILAHVASIEWTYPRLLDLARAAAAGREQTADSRRQSAPAGGAGEGVRRTTESGAPATEAQPAILSYNDRQVEKRASASVAELLAEFEKNRAATIAAVEAADDALLAAPVRSAGGLTGTLSDVLKTLAAEHTGMHAADIAGEAWMGIRF